MDHTIMVYDLELFVGLFLLFFLPVCVFVTIFSVILRFLFNLFCVLVVVVFVSNSKVKQEKTKGNFVTSANEIFILIFDLFDLV